MSDDERPMFWDRTGKPLTTDEWLKLWHTPFGEYRRVAVDQVGPVWISTVWVGCDTGDDPPLIFETRVDVDGDSSYFRYATEKEARDWHAALVRAAWESCP